MDWQPLSSNDRFIPPPPNTHFGYPLRSLWSLDLGIHFLNHGSFGAVPRHVLASLARVFG